MDISEEQKIEKPNIKAASPQDLTWQKYSFNFQDKSFEITDDLMLALEEKNCEISITAKDEEDNPLTKDDVLRPKGVHYISQITYKQESSSFRFEHSRIMNLTSIEFSGNCPKLDAHYISATRSNENSENNKVFLFKKELNTSRIRYTLKNFYLYSNEELILQKEDKEKGIPCSYLNIWLKDNEKTRACIDLIADGYYSIRDLPSDFQLDFEKNNYSVSLRYVNPLPNKIKIINKYQTPNQATSYIKNKDNKYEAQYDYKISLYIKEEESVDILYENILINADPELTIASFECRIDMDSDLQICEKRFSSVNNNPHKNIKISNSLAEITDQVFIQSLENPTQISYFSLTQNSTTLDNYTIVEQSSPLRIKVVGLNSKDSIFDVQIQLEEDPNSEIKNTFIELSSDQNITEYKGQNISRLPKDIASITIINKKPEADLNFEYIKIMSTRRAGKVYFFP